MQHIPDISKYVGKIPKVTARRSAEAVTEVDFVTVFLGVFASVYMGFRHLEMEIFMEKTSIKIDFDLIVYGKNIYIYYWKCYGF